MNENASTELQKAAIDQEFAEWVREAVRRFAADHDLLDAAIHKEVLRQYWDVYEDLVAKRHCGDDGPYWVGGSAKEVERVMREDFEKTSKFRDAAAWSKNGSRCLSSGRDWAGKPIDLATLNKDALRTLAALYLMALGDSVLLATEPPDWDAWRESGESAERSIAWLVDDLRGPSDGRFERIELVVERVLTAWNKIQAVDTDTLNSVSEPNESTLAETVESSLSGLSLKLFRRLRTSQHFVFFETLRQDVWKKEDSDREISDRGIEAAIERLRTALLETRFSVVIDAKRAKLEHISLQKPPRK